MAMLYCHGQCQCQKKYYMTNPGHTMHGTKFTAWVLRTEVRDTLSTPIRHSQWCTNVVGRSKVVQFAQGSLSVCCRLSYEHSHFLLQFVIRPGSICVSSNNLTEQHIVFIHWTRPLHIPSVRSHGAQTWLDSMEGVLQAPNWPWMVEWVQSNRWKLCHFTSSRDRTLGCWNGANRSAGNREDGCSANSPWSSWVGLEKDENRVLTFVPISCHFVWWYCRHRSRERLKDDLKSWFNDFDKTFRRTSSSLAPTDDDAVRRNMLAKLLSQDVKIILYLRPDRGFLCKIYQVVCVVGWEQRLSLATYDLQWQSRDFFLIRYSEEHSMTSAHHGSIPVTVQSALGSRAWSPIDRFAAVLLLLR